MKPKSNIARYHALDKLRGLLIANMGLGHAMAFSTGISLPELWYDTQSAHTNTAAFLVRFFNHSGTPMFFLVMGISMALLANSRMKQGWSNQKVISYFVSRGVLLIALQFTIINAGWSIGEGGLAWQDITFSSLFDPRGRWLYFGVLFALGTSMIVTAFLLTAGARILLPLAIVLLLSPHFYLLFVDYQPGATELPGFLGPLAIPGRWPDAWVLYTPVPWAGLTLLGVVLGRLLISDREKFDRVILGSGAVLLSLFLSVKLGQFLTSEPQSLFSFLHMTRYPPDLLLLAYALGVNFLLLFVFTRIDLGPLDKVLTTFGRTALFLYLMHLFIYGAIASLLGREVNMANAAASAILGLLIMYPFCWVYLHYVRPYWKRAVALGMHGLRGKTIRLGTRNRATSGTVK